MLTSTYLAIALVQLALAVWAWRLQARCPSFAAVTVALPIALLVWDNAVVAAGAALGDGPLLVALSWPRFVGHALLTPVWILTGFEYARHIGVPWMRGRGSRFVEWTLYLAMAGYGFVKTVVLMRFAPVVQGDLFYYTNGGGFPGPPLPAITMVVVVILAGYAMLRRTGWPWMLAGGVTMFVAAVVPTSVVGFIVSNLGEVLIALAMVATEAFLQRREAQSVTRTG